MDDEHEDEPHPSPEEIEFAQTVGRYDEVLSRCKLLRARLLITSADFSSPSTADHNKSVTALESLTLLEESFHRLSIQEEMLKRVKVSKLALDFLYGNDKSEDLPELMKQHCANQSQILEFSKELHSQRILQRKAVDKLLEQLCKYTSSLKDDQLKLASTSTSTSDTCNLEKRQKFEKKIKEIRFMQITIAKIISISGADLRHNKSFREILKSIREPLASVDDFLE